MTSSLQLRLYDTLTRDKRVFVPIDKTRVRMYVCGPTVYDFAHIGNARPVIVFDVLYRLLRHIYGDSHVVYVRNITDVDDKINARAARDFPGLPLNDAIRKVTEKTADQFHADVEALGCLPPTVEPRATDFVLPRKDGKADMVTLIQRLIERGHAYEAGGEVLFDTTSMADYGALAGRNLDDQLAGARIAVDAHKKHASDFVLWKQSSPDEPGWDSPWGRGRPGWHIECSAMSAAYLGEVFDIHGGGLDLIFPHHENEIAQSRCAHGTPAMANFWMHNGFLQVEGEKMSKSLGNFFTIRDLLSTKKFGNQRWNGDVLRFAMLQTHYRQPIDWTVSLLQQSEARLKNWKNFASDRTRSQIDRPLFDELLGVLADDLNTLAAFAIVDRVVASVSSTHRHRYTVYKFLKVLGLKGGRSRSSVLADNAAIVARAITKISQNDWENILAGVRSKPELNSGNPKAGSRLFATVGLLKERLDRIDPIIRQALLIDYISRLKDDLDNASIVSEGEFEKKIRELVEARNAARANRDFKESDRIRDELAGMGVVLKDSKEGTTWEVAR